MIERVVRGMRTVAVVGASASPDRPSHQVARYLLDRGVDVVAVNPNLDELFGRPAYPTLLALPGPVDVVDVFRRPEAVPTIAEQAVALGAGALWLQFGVISEEGARIAAEGGLDVVVDRCLKVEHALLR
ncbi:CoA-binding protein [Streptoalloteichus hindustanus]|uniref:CoA-binding domain-containing protein n=1 Tax=Streptoalloteichus hindustanus TaxID=2017 RepID=A0A1M5IUU8_STRHI|nr:CoA-binding protein [Streptoalloteichus hindustanus]SHG31740.1 hypothetical protein SAMN05444320_1082 [Streptoalloteichus hindustanus]